MALTLADVWNLSTDGRAIIVGQGGAIRATAGLVGRGACLVNGRRVIAASYSTRDGGWETNPECYRMAEYLKAINARKFWEQAGGTWMGHDIANPSAFRASSLFQRFEGEALMAIATNEAFGADEVTDLLLVEHEGAGLRRPRLRTRLAGNEGSRWPNWTARFHVSWRSSAARRAGMACWWRSRPITACRRSRATGRRHYTDDIVRRIHDRFDPAGKKLVTYYGDAANNQIYVDTERLSTLELSLKDVAAMLAGEPYLAAVFTEEDVREAQQRLSPRRPPRRD